MNDEKILKGLMITVDFICVILMVITIVLQIVAFNALRHVILCNCILLLITIELVCAGILKDIKEIAVHFMWYAGWLFNLIINLFRI